MQSEGFDNKIKEAAEHYFPAYDETAWKKMKRMLDVQMPQEKNDRWKLALLLFIVMLTGGGIYLLIDQPWGNRSTATSEQVISTPVTKDPPNQGKQASLPADESKPEVNETVTLNGLEPLTSVNGITSLRRSETRDKNLLAESATGNNNNTILAGDEPVTSQNNSTGSTGTATVSDPAPNTLKPSDHTDKGVTGIDNKQQSELKKDETLPETQKQDDPAGRSDEAKKENPENTREAKTKKPNKFLQNLGFTLAAGPDISAVHASEPGKTKPMYGAGLRYDISKRFSLRSGFYVSRKVYVAGPEDYNPPKSYWTNYVYLEQVDADCEIYEIPLQLNYHFHNGKKHSMFASAGISSYLMKRETYYYHYYDQSGQYQYNGWTMKDKNKHYFSVATLGAGYEYKLNEKFALSAEPYVKLPLAGVGFGKIKLNSGGILVTATVKPFASSLKKN